MFPESLLPSLFYSSRLPAWRRGRHANSIQLNAKRLGDSDPAAQAILALRKLDREVIVYRSLADWEEAGKLASVSLRQFESDLAMTVAEIEPLLAQIPSGKLRRDITNALDSYRDGLLGGDKSISRASFTCLR